MKTFKQFVEDGVAANSAGGGGVAGIGIGPDGEPGVKKSNKKKIVLANIRRKVNVTTPTRK